MVGKQRKAELAAGFKVFDSKGARTSFGTHFEAYQLMVRIVEYFVFPIMNRIP